MANPDAPILRDALKLAVAKLPREVRLRALNAYDGFDRARALLPIDREIASFRAITAEEEAAAALFRALQLRNYPGADSLNLGNHQHKAALGPFLAAATESMVATPPIQIQLTIDYSEPSVTIHLPLHANGIVFPGSEKLRLTLVEPLGLTGHSEDEGHPASFFDKHLKRIAEASKSSNIRRLIKREANARNRLLYASDSALPVSKVTVESLNARQRRAEIALCLCIAVLQTKNHQALASQALDAFLRLVGKPLAPNVSGVKVPSQAKQSKKRRARTAL